ncbi:hypothetical protein K439DRAFT_495743 [Ramaria rubella]|nr:hypothetical protein K439DRAFT_495743 [Ramaria rubella]
MVTLPTDQSMSMERGGVIERPAELYCIALSLGPGCCVEYLGNILATRMHMRIRSTLGYSLYLTLNPGPLSARPKFLSSPRVHIAHENGSSSSLAERNARFKHDPVPIPPLTRPRAYRHALHTFANNSSHSHVPAISKIPLVRLLTEICSVFHSIGKQLIKCSEGREQMRTHSTCMVHKGAS